MRAADGIAGTLVAGTAFDVCLIDDHMSCFVGNCFCLFASGVPSSFHKCYEQYSNQAVINKDGSFRVSGDSCPFVPCSVRVVSGRVRFVWSRLP